MLYKKAFYLSLFYTLVFFSVCKQAVGQKPEVDLDKEPYYTELKKALRHPDKVYKLRLCDQKLSEIPADLAKLSNLTVLFLDSNQIKTIPPFIKELKKLLYLSINDNQISTLPPELFELTQLKILYLEANQIEGIPTNIADLFNLRSLILRNNKIKVIPIELGKLRELEILDLSMNQVKKVPDEFSHLYKLERLSLAQNNIRKLPPHFHELRALEVLHLSGNEFSTIDSSLFDLTRLEILALDSNQLHSLPNTIGRTYSLKRLYLDKNQFDTIPAVLSSLFDLEILNVEDNPIKLLPPALKDLRKLKKLYINKLQTLQLPAVLFDMQRNGTEIKGLDTKDLFDVKILMSRGKNKKLTENYTEAVTSFESVIKKDTNNVDALALLAGCYLELGEFVKAEECCKKALSKNPSVNVLGELQINLSNAQNKTNKTTSGNSVFEDKIKADPTNVKPLLDFGKYLYMQRKFNESKEVLEKAVKLHPNNAEANFYLAIDHLSLDHSDPFALSVLRYLMLQPQTRKSETVLPFLLSKTGMRTGVESKKGSKSYYDSYIVRDEDGSVIYKSENPQADVLAAIFTDLTTNLLKSSEAKDDSTKEIMKLVAKALDQNNVQRLQSNIQKMCEKDKDSIPQLQKATWDHFIPYYRAMIKEGHLETFSYIINAIRREDEYIVKWKKENPAKIQAFYDWDKTYKWP